MWKKILPALALVVLSVCLGFFPARAQDGPPQTVTDDMVNVVARQLYCPVCQNTPLDVCPTQACEEWRGLIREKLELGWSTGQIKTYFINQYGDRVVGAPPLVGLNWLAYIVPLLAILAGAFFLLRTMTAWRRRGVQAVKPGTDAAGAQSNADVKPAADANSVYIQQLEEELRKR